MWDSLLETLSHLPMLVRFAITMAVFLLVPPLCRRVRLPAVVGLLLAGVILSPGALHIVSEEAPVAEFFAEIGKLLLMFFAGLEIELSQFRRTGGRSLLFGALTFSLPLAAGVLVSVAVGYGWLAALLIGSLLASHTLLGHPTVHRMGLTDDEAVTVTVGGTVFTDIGALLVLAVCLPIHRSGFSAGAFALQLAELAGYVLLVVVGLSTLGQWLLRRMGQSKESQFSLVFIILALAGVGAEAINLEAIIGAFLAGLAVNSALRHSEAKEELEFLGNTLFIPMFFVTIGFLIDVRLFLRTLVDHVGLVVGIVGGLIASKFLAAKLTQQIFGYTRTQGRLMWSLSLPQVAATLAAALVAYETKNAEGVRLIDEPVVNTVIVLLVVTSILGPVLTEFYGKQLLAGRDPMRESAVASRMVEELNARA
jgi:Kef-type K+ transport system membrane component KefB